MNRGLYFKNLREWYRRVFWHGNVHACEQREDPKTEPAEDENARHEICNCMLTVPAEKVLKDLQRFCRASVSCVVFDRQGQVDTHATAVLEGRREVWLKIVQTLNITDEQLIKLINAGNDEGEDDDN